MRRTRGKSVGVVAAALMWSAAAMGQGADVIVGDIDGVANYTPAAADAGFDAFAIGTISCNIGTVNLNWYTASNSQYNWDNRHPVISQNLFRLHGGRFEHIGQAWLKHGFTALTGNLCGSCNGQGGSVLGVGCSDPYGAGLNGSQSGLGPKWQVNAASGIFPYGFAAGSGSGEMFKRIKVRTADLDPANYPGALFFVEGHYICGDDAAAGNDNNNASYRRVQFSAVTGSSGNPNHFAMSLVSGNQTVREQAAIYAWRANDPSVVISTVDVPSDGRFIVGCKVTNNGGSPVTYTYEYAVHNFSSHRSAGSFSVPYPNGTVVSNVGYHDVEYHSGEPNQAPTNPNDDNWLSSSNATAITWSGPGYNGTDATYTMHPTVPYMLSAAGVWQAGTGNNHSANALRWATLYNLRFTTTVAPATGAVQIGLWRPGTGSAAFATVPTPGGATGGAPTTGSCCIGQTCSVTTIAGCSGTFGGLGTTCNPDPCILPIGTCCNTIDGSCSTTTQAACTGTWVISGTCTPNPCPQPLTNDACVNAIALCDGVPVVGTTVGATPDGSANCAGSSGSGPSVWYKYTPSGTTGTVSVTVDTCSGSYDTAISIWSGACPGVTQVGCDDDSCGNLKSRLVRTLNRGQTYLIRVGGYNGATGTFTVTATGGGGVGPGCAPMGACCSFSNCDVTAQSACTGGWTSGGTCSPNVCPPFNDDCQNRIGIGTGTTAFVNTYATTDGPEHNPGCTFFSNSQINRDLWYNFPSTFTGQLRIDTCGSAFDTKIAVYDDTGCTNFESRLLACNDDNAAAAPAGCGASSLQSSVIINVIPNRSYTIRVGSFGTTANGAGVLNLTAIPSVVSGACCAPDGSCLTLTQVGCSGAYQGDGTTCSPNPCPQPEGTCCAPDGSCTFVTDVACVHVWSSGGACSPNPCPQPPTGACCNGTACSVGTQAACTGTYEGNGSACGPTGNPTTCCPANFNQTGGLSVQDIFDFLSAYFANDPSADINGIGGLSVQDIFDFLSAYFAGCPG